MRGGAVCVAPVGDWTTCRRHPHRRGLPRPVRVEGEGVPRPDAAARSVVTVGVPVPASPGRREMDRRLGASGPIGGTIAR